MKRFRTNSLSTWFLRALRHQHHQRFGPAGNYYEFGVGKGRTLTRFLRALRVFCDAEALNPYIYSIFLFDSFEGMPGKASPRDDHPGFSKGILSVNIEQTRARIRKYLDLRQGTVRFIKGFFEDSLTPALAQELSAHPPSIVTVDVDYYSSTKSVLEWLLPFAPTGCLFYFDDIWLFYGHPEMGQIAAINEFNQTGAGYMIPYPELGTTVGGRSFVFARKKFELSKSRW
ncbi:MAG TPA: TylF/MycF/NovP-related O-methyltransferase [Candidatus Binataceae bacterium]|nr:TylF/MycF/NovP-related O-methyltransferase [Candidatus Binataceae bacterium]